MIPWCRLPASLRLTVMRHGGDDGNRTHDPLLAGQVLSQLSYTPMWDFLSDDHSKLNNKKLFSAVRTCLVLGLLYSNYEKFRLVLLTFSIERR